jgi:phosphate transport system substrate-binding protein
MLLNLRSWANESMFKFHFGVCRMYFFRCIAPTVLIIVSLPASIRAQTSQAKSDAEASALQAARAKSVLRKGHEVHYPPDRFDLSDLPHYEPEVQVSGTIRQWGSNYLTDSPLASYLETAFQKFQPNVTFSDNLRTSEHAISSLVFGVADVGIMGRQIMWDERLSFQREFNYQPTGIIGMTGSYDVSGWNPPIGFYVNSKNPLVHLSMAQIDGIFGDVRTGAYDGLIWDEKAARGADKNIRTWGQLGLSGEWADKPIHVLGYNLEFHFPEEIETRAFGGVTSKFNGGLLEYSNSTNADGTLKIAGQTMIEDVAKDPYAIAYVAGGELWKTAAVKTLAIGYKENGPFEELTMDNVRNRTYPFYADIFFWINRDPKKPVDPKLREYLRFILSREGQEQIVRDGKYLPLTKAVIEEERKKLD